MIVAVTVDFPGGTEQQYDQILDRIFRKGSRPEGWLVHIAGPTEDGWRVLNVAARRRSSRHLPASTSLLIAPMAEGYGAAS